jgi:hypothetical protein
MEPISAKHILTESEQIVNLKRSFYSETVIRIGAVGFLFVFLLGILTLLDKGMYAAWPSLALPVLIYTGFLILPGVAGRKAFRDHPEESDREISWMISDEGILVTNRLLDETWDWGDLTKAKFYEDAVGIRSKSRKMFAFMPKKGFADTASYERAAEVITEKVLHR